MTALQAAILGLVQGLTEFLPISSSAHLILTSYFLGWQDQGLRFDIAVHLGSMLAVLLYVRQDVLGICRSFLGGAGSGDRDPSYRRLGAALLVGTIPVGLGGLLLRGFVGSTGREPLLIAATSLVFALALGIADRVGSGRRSFSEIGWRDGLWIGLAQAIALVPGTSRAGITITMALLLACDREAAARFSFLLAVPVSVLVAVRQLMDLGAGAATNGAGAFELAVGFLVSGVAAYLAIGFLVRWVRRQDFSLFVVYRIVLGLVIFATIWI